MPHPDAVEWNARYLSEPERMAPGAPRALLTSHLDALPPGGLALDMACGTAGTGLFLAARGWQVTGLDVAESALRIARAHAPAMAGSVSLAVMDVLDPWLPACHFDLILNFYFLSRQLFPTYKQALKPGGLLFFETFVWEPGITLKPERYLQPGELREAFSGWEMLHYTELDQPRGSGSARGIAQLVARRPGGQGDLK